jgi:V/A-type H+-transporting ATPase subunit D
MAKKKIKTTRPELKRMRDALTRYERYLPMLKLKQQQLQLMVRQINQKRREAAAAAGAAREVFDRYRAVVADVAGVSVKKLAAPAEVKTSTTNVAGVAIPVFEGVTFPEARYSLFATPPWVDATLSDLRDLNMKQAALDVIDEQQRLIQRELTKILQRVNLFEKVKIPEVREAIRVIRIHLGDEMTSAVGRAKIAKGKLAAKAAANGARGEEAQAS